MKLSPIFALIAETWAQEATGSTDLSLDELFESAINDVARSTGNDYYSDYEYDYDYYYDALGNKKKKKKQKKQKQQNNSYSKPVSNYKPQNNKPAAPSNNNWAPQNSWGAKGTTWNTDRSPLIGNGRFCWNCYARADENGSAYQNCFDGDQKGFLEMCTGEEYFCMWNERRQSGRVTEVGGGCKSDHSCLDQMTENFKWKTVSLGQKVITGDQCRAGANKNAGIAFENSVCTWCCDAMVTNRFAPTENDLCNFKTYANSPAKKYFDEGSTETFEWFNATNQFAGLYTDGQYHRMFMIAIQVALGQGILSG